MEIQSGHKQQIDQKVLDTVLVTNPLDHKAKAECRICHDDEMSGSLITPCKCSGSMEHVHQSCLKDWIKEKYPLNETSRWSPECEICHYKFVISWKIKRTIFKCPEIAAQDKLRHVIFCSSILFMPLCLSIIFFCFAYMRDQTEKSMSGKGDDKYDILLVVFGIALFGAVIVAIISQRKTSPSIIQVAKQFFRNTKEWTVTSMDKQFDVAAEEEV